MDNKLLISIILSVLITAIVVGGGVYLLQKSAFEKEKQQMQQQINSLNNQISKLSSQAENETKEFEELIDAMLKRRRLFIHSKYSYGFRYPNDLEVTSYCHASYPEYCYHIAVQDYLNDELSFRLSIRVLDYSSIGGTKKDADYNIVNKYLYDDGQFVLDDNFDLLGYITEVHDYHLSNTKGDIGSVEEFIIGTASPKNNVKAYKFIIENISDLEGIGFLGHTPNKAHHIYVVAYYNNKLYDFWLSGLSTEDYQIFDEILLSFQFETE